MQTSLYCHVYKHLFDAEHSSVIILLHVYTAGGWYQIAQRTIINNFIQSQQVHVLSETVAMVHTF